MMRSLLKNVIQTGWVFTFLFVSSCAPPPPLDLSPSAFATAPLDGGQSIETSPEILTLPAGDPMTGAVWTGDPASLPLTNYRLSFEARRTEGGDFFASPTFPVGSLETCVTLIAGGWGGSLVGISSIDDLDAREGLTGTEQPFEDNHWHRFVIDVTPSAIVVHIDDRPVIRANIQGRKLGLKPGPINLCAPLGFASWRTTGEIREVMLVRLDPE